MAKGDVRMTGSWEVNRVRRVGESVENSYEGRKPSTTIRFEVHAYDTADPSRSRTIGVRAVVRRDGRASVYREDSSYKAGVIRIHCTSPTDGTKKKTGPNRHGGLNTRFGAKVWKEIRPML